MKLGVHARRSLGDVLGTLQQPSFPPQPLLPLSLSPLPPAPSSPSSVHLPPLFVVGIRLLPLLSLLSLLSRGHLYRPAKRTERETSLNTSRLRDCILNLASKSMRDPLRCTDWMGHGKLSHMARKKGK